MSSTYAAASKEGLANAEASNQEGVPGGATEGSVDASPAIAVSPGTSSPGRRSSGEGVPGATAAPGSLAEPRRSSAEDYIARTSPDETGGDVRPPRARRSGVRGGVFELEFEGRASAVRRH